MHDSKSIIVIFRVHLLAQFFISTVIQPVSLDPFIVELEFDNFAIGFYARFPNIVIFRSWWTAKDALDKKVNLYNDYNFVKLASDSLSWHELIIIVRAAKDAHAFVIDVDLNNEKKNILALGW